MMAKEFVKKVLFQDLLFSSLKSSSEQRSEHDLKQKLTLIAPDISKQYTMLTVAQNDRYLFEKIRSLHAFQVNLLKTAIRMLNSNKVTIADIGDSSGVHMEYIESLMKTENVSVDAYSVNLDPVAIEKIKALGRKAILCRAEELHQKMGLDVDIFCTFEVLEHFFDPISFLKTISSKANAKKFVVSVPYMQKSRVGLQFIRHHLKGPRISENTHIFELSPEDWDLIFKFSGWKVVHRDLFLQYPKYHFLSWTKLLWRKFDFEGFYGVILEKDDTYSSMYQDWH